MKKYITLLLISVLLVSCWKEDRYIDMDLSDVEIDTSSLDDFSYDSLDLDISWDTTNKNLDYYDGYEWAEDNDIDSFDECDDEFWSSYGWAEDGCNEYVQEEHYTFDTTFWDYECTEDCSGHEAGYDWAEDNWIEDEDDCDNWSNSFEEWCLEYVEENN